VIVVASADPGAPIAGKPQWPKTSTQSNPAFSRLLKTTTATSAFVRFMACRLCRSATNSSIGVMLGAEMWTNATARGITSAGSWSA